jgi:hypothetical protein
MRTCVGTPYTCMHTYIHTYIHTHTYTFSNTFFYLGCWVRVNATTPGTVVCLSEEDTEKEKGGRQAAVKFDSLTFPS